MLENRARGPRRSWQGVGILFFKVTGMNDRWMPRLDALVCWMRWLYVNVDVGYGCLNQGELGVDGAGLKIPLDPPLDDVQHVSLA